MVDDHEIRHRIYVAAARSRDLHAPSLAYGEVTMQPTTPDPKPEYTDTNTVPLDLTGLFD